MNHTYPGLRIAVVGTSGASAMSSILSQHFGIPHVQIDRAAEHRTTGREQSQSVLANIAERDTWVLDASSPIARDLVWPQANIIVWVDYARHVITGHAVWRFLRGLISEGISTIHLLRALWGYQSPNVDYSSMMDTRWVRLTTLRDTRAWMREIKR